MSGSNGWVGMLKESVADFWNNHCMSMAGAIAYSTVISLPAMFILILAVTGLFVEPRAVQEALQSQLGAAIGPTGREQIGAILGNARNPDIGKGAVSLLGIGVLFVGATGAFVQLQSALNRAWRVKPDPDEGGVKAFLLKRVLSFGLILGLAFLLLVWIHHASLIVLFGAQFTRSWARRRVKPIQPAEGAVRVVETEREIR